jgi:AcrR family transcriptional regulator
MVKQEDRRAATRSGIIAAARSAFGQHGYAEVSVDHIAAQAGVAKGAVYHHFQSKDALFEAALEVESAAVLAEVVAAITNAHDFRSALSIGNRAFFVACSDPLRAKILLHDGPAVLGWARWRQIDQRNFGGLIKLAILNAIDQSLTMPRDPEVLMRILLGAVTEAVISASESDDFMACAEVYLEAIGAMVEGWTTPTETAS